MHGPAHQVHTPSVITHYPCLLLGAQAAHWCQTPVVEVMVGLWSSGLVSGREVRGAQILLPVRLHSEIYTPRH